MDFQKLSGITCDALGLGWLTGMRLTVEIDQVQGFWDMRRDVNFRLSNWAYNECQLYKLTITSGEFEGRPGAVFSMHGDEDVDIELSLYVSEVILPSQTSITLKRPPVDGSVEIRGTDWTSKDFTISGQTVTIPSALTEYVRVFYRPVLTVRCVEWKISGIEGTAQCSWSAVFEEQPA